MSDKKEVYDENNDYDETVGYCLYCKEDIKSTDTYVVKAGDKYHTDCYKLLEEEDED